jgi:hypothetical protein
VVDLDKRLESLCPPRRRGINAKHKSRDEGSFNHSDWEHCSKVGRSDDLIHKHCSINCIHSKKKIIQLYNYTEKISGKIFSYSVTRSPYTKQNPEEEKQHCINWVMVI